VEWLKNKDTVLFLGVWERINNPDFNSLEFEGIKNEAGRNSFFLSAKKWIELTGAKERTYGVRIELQLHHLMFSQRNHLQRYHKVILDLYDQ